MVDSQISKKKIIIFIVLNLILTLFVFYGYNQYSPKKHRLFGVTYMTMNNDFYDVLDSWLRDSIEGNGDELITLDPLLDVEKQIEQIDYLISKGVDGIFINPVDSDLIEPALEKCKAHHIPVIVIDSEVRDDNLVISTVISDNYQAGVLCAQDLMSKKESAKIVLLCHSTVLSATNRIQGFLDTITPEYKIVKKLECEGQIEFAMPLIQSIIDQEIEFDVIMALNDPSALGALSSIKERNAKNVMIYGVDGNPTFKNFIYTESDYIATTAQSPKTMAKTATEMMYDYLAGKEINKMNLIPVRFLNKDNITKNDLGGWE